MRSKQRRIFCFAILLLSLSVLTYAQVSLKGEISGSVLDENGQALPGISITLTGKKLFQSSLSAVSAEKGLFRFLNLNPGNYELNFTFQGFNPLKISNIIINAGKTTPIRAILTPGGLDMAVEVTAEAPLIETKTTQLSTSYSSLIIEKIPTGRTFIDLVNATPAMNDGGGAYGAGGIRGGLSVSNSYRLNGVDVSNLDYGDTWVRPSYDTIEEIQIIGIGASAEYGNFTGATINMITKSGSNEFHGGLGIYYTDGNIRGDNSKNIEDLTPADIKYNAESSVFIGGPLIKEKLFLFLAGGYAGNQSKGYKYPDYNSIKQVHFQLKLDFLASNRNTFSLMVNTDPSDKSNMGLRPNSGPEIAYTEVSRTTSLFGSWQSILSDQMILNVKYAGYWGQLNRDPDSPDTPAFRDGGTGIYYGSSGRIRDHHRTRNEAYASLLFYADDFLGAAHEFKFGLEYGTGSAENTEISTGNMSFSTIPTGDVTVILGNVGLHQHTKHMMKRIGFYVQDNIQIGKKVTLNLGVRYDQPRLTADDYSGELVNYINISPRIGLSYDFTGDAKNVIHLHYGRYYDKLTTYGWQLAIPQPSSYEIFNLVYPGAFKATPENIANLPNLVIRPENSQRIVVGGEPYVKTKPEVDSSGYSDVFNIGFEKQLFNDFVLSIDYIYKQDRNMIVIGDKTQHTYEQITGWADPWLGNTPTLWNQTDRVPAEYYYHNSDWAKKRHHILTIVFRKRQIGNWSMMASFTYQNSEGNVDNNDAVALGLWPWGRDTDPYYTQNDIMWGKLWWDRPYQFKLLGSYNLPWGLIVSGDFRLMSGQAYNATAFNRYIPNFPMYRPHSTFIYLEKRGIQRFPGISYFNLRLAKSFRIGDSSRVELMADVLNAFNQHTGQYTWLNAVPYWVYSVSGESLYGKPYSLIAPVHARLGVRLTF